MGRRALLLGLGAATLLAGCGFRPVYDTQGSGIGPVVIGAVEGRTGYFLRRALERRAALERGDGPPRRLDVALSTAFLNVAQGPDAFGTRSQMTVTAAFEVRAPRAEQPTKGAVSTMVGFETFREAYGDVTLQADAEERAAERLADLIWAELRRLPRDGR
jgi:LPS-assembly lipoprotein